MKKTKLKGVFKINSSFFFWNITFKNVIVFFNEIFESKSFLDHAFGSMGWKFIIYIHFSDLLFHLLLGLIVFFCIFLAHNLMLDIILMSTKSFDTGWYSKRTSWFYSLDKWWDGPDEPYITKLSLKCKAKLAKLWLCRWSHSWYLDLVKKKKREEIFR